MKILLPLSALRAHNACGLDERIAAFTAFHGHAPNENTPFSAWVEVTPKVGDLTWATRCLFEAGKRIAVKIAVQAARRALPVWKSVNPEDLRPRLAIEAVENWLLGKVTTEEPPAFPGDATPNAGKVRYLFLCGARTPIEFLRRRKTAARKYRAAQKECFSIFTRVNLKSKKTTMKFGSTSTSFF